MSQHKIENYFELGDGYPVKIGHSLDELGIKHGTDKSSVHHDYLKVYEKYFQPLRDKSLILLELGYGGYHYEDRGGESARMWQEYFQNGEIVSIDFCKKNPPPLERIQVYQCSQDDEVGLQNIIYTNGRPDIIIDDASHIQGMTIRSFQILFPLLKPGGIYVVEDLQTSYWKDHGFGGDPVPGTKSTAIQYILDLCHQMNHVAFETKYHHEFKDMIESIHMYRQMAFIFKK